MTTHKSTYQFVAQAETLLIYGIFLFLTGLAQIGVTISHRYITVQANTRADPFALVNFLPTTFTMTDIHLWYIYPSAAWTIIPFFCCVSYAICKRKIMAIFICASSLISFVSSSVYVGLLIIHTLEYWQTISSHRFKALASPSITTITTTASIMRLLVPFDEPATFTNLALLITFTLALVQALLSMIGAVISCLWSPCCIIPSTQTYKPVAANAHYVQTSPHRYETPQSSTIRSIKRQQQQQQQHHHPETHRFIASSEPPESVLNGFLHRTSPMRSNYDEV